MIDIGSGPPLVLIPGIQGRWEWMRPTVKALARRFRVITFSLCGDRGSRRRLDPALGFDNFVAQIDEVLDACRLQQATLCGVSFGGLIAVHYAARRAERVSAVVLVSSLGPTWRPDDHVARQVRAPWRSTPAFLLGSPGRLYAEIAAAFPNPLRRVGFMASHAARVLAAPFWPPLMAARVQLATSVDFQQDCARITAPMLVVTGEPHLDKVVPVASTREYVRVIPGAASAVIERTGHIGLVMRPDRFAECVGEFVAASSAATNGVA